MDSCQGFVSVSEFLLKKSINFSRNPYDCIESIQNFLYGLSSCILALLTKDNGFFHQNFVTAPLDLEITANFTLLQPVELCGHCVSKLLKSAYQLQQMLF